jgi:hypothetical protein
MYQADIGGGGQATSAPLGIIGGSASSTGQYVSGGGAPRSAPTQQQGQVQRSGNQQRNPAKKKPKKGPHAPGINKYLAGDTTYQDQMSQLRKQLEQFRTSNSSQKNNVGLDFKSALEKLSQQRTTDLGSLENDYSARGMLNSGLYTDALNQYNTGYNQQYSDLNTDQQRSLADLLESLNNYGTENSSSLAAAKADAIRRRAQQYGITA